MVNFHGTSGLLCICRTCGFLTKEPAWVLFQPIPFMFPECHWQVICLSFVIWQITPPIISCRHCSLSVDKEHDTEFTWLFILPPCTARRMVRGAKRNVASWGHQDVIRCHLYAKGYWNHVLWSGEMKIELFSNWHSRWVWCKKNAYPENTSM